MNILDPEKITGKIGSFIKRLVLGTLMSVSFVPVLDAQEVIRGKWYFDGTPVSVEIRDGMIIQITRLTEAEKGEDFPDWYIAPGLIDNQVNGFDGVTFALGGGSDLTAGEVMKATSSLWKYGVTTYLPTLTTNTRELFIRNLKIIASVMNSEETMGSIAGIHMEGPYINPEDGYRGAHPKEHVRLPDWNEFMELCRASGENILQITVAPEMEGALDFISQCSRMGIVVALGHHNAPAAVVTAAIDRGAKIATHLGNGAANMINRHLNPFWSQLADHRLSASIICDSFHLLPEEIQVFYKVKGLAKTILTSDVTSYGGLPPGDYKSDEGHHIKITPEGKLWNVDQNGLYGSATPVTYGIGHVMKVTGCTLAEAIQMATLNPANLYGLDDRGALEPGKRADIILFHFDEMGTVRIQKTYVKGKLVHENK